MSSTPERSLYDRIYALVSLVPPGKVATYGDIAEIVGGCDARTVGYALNSLPKSREHDVPWQRIINSQGGISTRGTEQRAILEAEGIVFDERGRIPLSRFRWKGPGIDGDADEEDDAGQLPLF
ncbi:MAG: putative methyltransferase [Chloroflexi bacterium]|nr:putative methyltransferase [Chloroflexota bacterium]